MVKHKNKQRKKSKCGAERVRMHRERKRLKNSQQQFLNEQPIQNEMSIGMDISSMDAEEPSTLNSDLRDWANSHRVTTRALDDLLRILNSNGITSIPKNHRTLLNTPTDIVLIENAGGQLWYNGIEKSLRQIFTAIDRDISISLNISIDGLPLYRSCQLEFWPILASIHGMCVVYNNKYSTAC